MPKQTRVPMVWMCGVKGFCVKIILPLDLTPAEHHRVKTFLDTIEPVDPSEGAKFAVSDPNTMPEITL